MTLRDIAVLEDIVSYCERIQQYLSRSGNSQDSFERDTMVQDACCMCVVQIGELVGLLSDEAKQSLSHVPWRLIKETRNFYVHNYGNISQTLVWATLKDSIPDLKASCKQALESESRASSMRGC